MKSMNQNRSGFCIYVDTVCDGAKPVELNERGYPFVYPTLVDAQREIAQDTMERLRQFLEGERDFEDAMTVAEYIVEVDVLSDGSVSDAAGNVFGA
jgi:hypothetical protein